MGFFIENMCSYTLHLIFQVKFWITLNEPWVVSVLGYENGEMAPGIKGKGDHLYIVAHNLIKAHAKAYRLYEKEFKSSQKGMKALTYHTIQDL